MLCPNWGPTSGKLYAIGGEDHLPEPVDTVDIYDPTTNGWAAGPGMSEKRSSPACCVLADRIYVTGGDDDSDTRLASVEVSAPPQKIIITTTTTTTTTTARHFHVQPGFCLVCRA